MLPRIIFSIACRQKSAAVGSYIDEIEMEVLFRLSAKPNQANGSATPQRTAIGKNDTPPYLAYRVPDNKVSAAVAKPEPNA